MQRHSMTHPVVISRSDAGTVTVDYPDGRRRVAYNVDEKTFARLWRSRNKAAFAKRELVLVTTLEPRDAHD